MGKIKRLVAAAVVSGMICQVLPGSVIAAEVNTVEAPEAYGATPNQSQINYHEEELAAFIHFGMNTFTNSEWGNGRENPNSFNPTNLNTDEWVRVLKEAGFKRVILVGKHHDGFCLWPSEVTDHDVESSTDWQASQGGNGDVLAALSESCTKYDMDMGIYLSPWDAHEESYGYGDGTNDATDTNGDYNEFYMTQLREILGNPKYGNNGKFVEVWMDGAKGSGAAAQNYKFDEWFNLIEELQPGALVFSPYGTGVRWIGNESGRAGDPVWSKVNLKRIRDRYDAGSGDDNKYLNNGDPEGDIWSVGECDVSLTSGWFWHNGNSPKTMEQLTDIYFSSVGRGQPLLLNVAPDNTGNFTAADIERVQEFSQAIKNSFDENLAASATAEATSIRGNSDSFSASNVLDDNDDTYWTMNDGQTTGSLTINLGGPKTFDVVSIEEYIKLGQRISEFSVEVSSDGQNWNKFGEGYTIGAKRLVRGVPVTASHIRINIEGSYAVPLIENVEVYKADEAFEMEALVPQGTEFIDNPQFENKSAWIQESIGINSTGMYSSAAGTHASFKFTGTKAWVIGTLDPNHGIMEVWIDDEKVDEIDTYQAKREISQIIYTTDDLEYGDHTVKIVVKGTKNDSARGTAIGLDGAYYLGNNGAGMFEIENTAYTVDEGNSVEVTVKRVAGTTGAATVHLSTSPDSAVHGRHYSDITKTIQFADGQEEATVSIETIDNDESAGDVKFYCNIDTPTNNSIIGFNKRAEITIIDNDIEQEVDEPYTEERPFVFPSTLDVTKKLEAEHFTLQPIEGNKYVRVQEDSNASNGKKIGWFEPGNVIKVPFNAAKAGTYTVKAKYQSGRDSSNQNKLNWSGTNVVSGSKSVPGTGNQNPIPFIETSFDIEVTKSGAGELVFTADSQASPNIDYFEIVAKELKVEATNVALNKKVTGFWKADNSAVNTNKDKPLSNIVSGNKQIADYADFGSDSRAESSYVQIDLEKTYDISSMNLYRYWQDGRTYKGTVIAVSNTADFAESTIVYNSDAENFHGLGAGEDKTYAETSEGKTIEFEKVTGRYVRVYMHGSSTGNTNHIVELEVMGIESSEQQPEIPETPEQVQAGINMTVAEEITVGDDLNLKVNLSDVKQNMYAMEFEVDYDETKVDFVEATSMDASKYMVSAEAKDGKVKVVVAGLGVALENAKDIANLKFTAKDNGEGVAFELINGTVSDGEGKVEDTKTSTVTTTIKKGVDKSGLSSVITSAKETIKNDSDKYTEASINALNEAIKLAEETLDNKVATQEQVNEAKAAVEAAVKNLVEKEESSQVVDKTALKITIDYANELKDSGALNGVVPAVEKEFNEALAEAESLYGNKNATEAEVKASFDRLSKVIQMLEFKEGDKSALQTLVDGTNALNKDKYTAESWAKVEAVLAEANSVLADENAMQKEIDEVASKLQQAVEELEEKSVNTVDKSLLQGLVDRVDETDSTKYIPSTWTPFAKALEVANTVLSNESATQEEVNSAYNALLKAYLGLRLTPDKSMIEDLIKEIEGLDLAGFTEDSVKVLQKSMSRASRVLNNKEASQAEVDEALANLEEAKNSLVANNGGSSTNTTASNGNSANANTGSNSSNGKLPQTGTAGVAGVLMSGALSLLAGLGLYRRKK